MHRKKPERDEPSGYAFGVECGAARTRKVTKQAQDSKLHNLAVAKRHGFPLETSLSARKDRCDEA